MVAAARVILAATVMMGCAARAPEKPHVATATAAGLSASQFHERVKATCAPPSGWVAKPIEIKPQCAQQVWTSPSGRTAYGIIHFRMPFPVAHDLLLWFFLNEMRSSEGEATLLEKRFDGSAGALRYVARGGKYTVRSNLLVNGFDGWVIYAGTLTSEAVLADELALAEQAREQTRVGAPPNPPVAAPN
jgi:hypothetical protein